jgi:hypothetical protein
MPPELVAALQHAVEALGKKTLPGNALELIATANRAGELRNPKLVRWLSDPENVLEAIEIGRRIKQEQQERKDVFAEFRGTLGV